MLAQFSFSVRCAEYTLRVTGLGARHEGVMSRVSVGFFTRRAKTCQQVVHMLQHEGLVMVHGAPRTGKTSLCQLMAITARHSNMFQQVFYSNCAAVSSATSFDSEFQRSCGVTFDEAAQQASESNRTLLIIDDAHRTYEVSACLWGWAKHTLDHPTTPHPIMILTASSHRSKPLASMVYTAPLEEFAATRSIVFRYSLAASQLMLCCHLLPTFNVIPQ